jgi:hypothetical protein
MISAVGLKVPLEPGQEAVVLVERDGVFAWQLMTGESTMSPPAETTGGPRKRKGARRAARVSRGPKRYAHFRIELVAVQPTSASSIRRRRRRGGMLGSIAGKAIAFVFRFVAQPILKGVAKWLERKVDEGLVHVSGADSTDWRLLGPNAAMPVALPTDRPPRVLLFVHGTFSSTVGSFGALSSTDEGRTFLAAALSHYDLIMGWDHRTLTVTPDANASDLLGWMSAQHWRRPPEIDAIAFSRGGLVYRSLVEQLVPQQNARYDFKRAVFVGCTNGGTELARPENWHRFADRYTNLAAAGSRALGVIPGFLAATRVFEGAVRGVAGLIKGLATAALTDKAIPGLAAMNPGGKFVRTLNTRQAGQPTIEDTYYCAITSNFDPDLARQEGRVEEIPPGLMLSLADKATDQLYGKPNDLVVHVDSMTEIDPEIGTYVRERLDYGVNGVVHHCRYFLQGDTAGSIHEWLEIEAG